MNAWGVMHVLYTFTGMPAAGPRNERDWILTTVWAVSIDAVAAGLIFMVFSSYIMWYRLKAKRVGGMVALGLGFVICANPATQVCIRCPSQWAALRCRTSMR